MKALQIMTNTVNSVMAAAVFVLAVTLSANTAVAQNRSQLSLTAEPTQISQGALADAQIQANPSLYNAAQGIAPVEAGRTTGGQIDLFAPPLIISFDTINFNQNATLTGFFSIPPDPAGAAGPSHVVDVVNTSIEWYTKAGVMQNRQSLRSFFTSQSPATGTFDPKVIYDQYQNRFVVLTMERVEAAGATPNQSRVFLAVSDDSDPNGTWYFTTLNTEETITSTIGGVNAARESWADFPGLAVDSEAIYFTTNMFAHNNQPNGGLFTGQRLWIIAKAPFYSGGAAATNRYNPAGATGGVATTMQPAQMYNDTPGGIGNFLVAYSGITDGVNRYLQIIRVNNPLAGPTFTLEQIPTGPNAAVDNGTYTNAPQLGTTRTIATGDRRVSQNAVWRNNLLYLAAPTVAPVGPDTGQVTVRWYRVNTAAASVIVDQGTVGGEDIAAGTYTFFPSVSVDNLGNMAIGFAASGPNIYPGAYYTGRLVADAPGTAQTASALRAGGDYYIRDFTTSMTVSSRWGDYTGVWLDPTNERTFWVFNEYALTRGTILAAYPEEDGRWGTAFGAFALAPSTAASVTVGGRVLDSTNRGVSGAFVYLTNSNGETRTARTNSFGYYRFEDIEVGQSIVVTVVSKRYQFTPQVVFLTEGLTNLDFTAVP